MEEYKKLYQKVLKKENEFKKVGDELLIYAQQFVDWARLRWEWQPSDGYVFGIEGEYYIDAYINPVINDLSLVSFDDFFYIVKEKGKVSPEDFHNNTI